MNKVLLFLILSSSILSSCSKKEYIHGFSFNDLEKESEIIAKIKTQKTDELEVMNLLGSPTITSDFGKRTFFYIQSKFSEKMFFKPKLVDQKVLEISFNNRHIVSDLKFYDINDTKYVEYDKKTTFIQNNKMSVIEQFTKNIGRFNTPSGKKKS